MTEHTLGIDIGSTTLKLCLLSRNGGGEEHEVLAHAHAFAWSRLVKPLGVVTLVLLLLTAGAGLFRRRSPRVLLKLHKILAALTVISALCHAAIVFLFH